MGGDTETDGKRDLAAKGWGVPKTEGVPSLENAFVVFLRFRCFFALVVGSALYVQ